MVHKNLLATDRIHRINITAVILYRTIDFLCVYHVMNMEVVVQFGYCATVM